MNGTFDGTVLGTSPRALNTENVLKDFVAFDDSAPAGLVRMGVEGMDATLDGNVSLVTLASWVGELVVLASVTDFADTSAGSFVEETGGGMIFLIPQPPGFPFSGG